MIKIDVEWTKPEPIKERFYGERIRLNLRSYASMLWGNVCKQYATSRTGMSFYSCEGHGGILVNGYDLSKEEGEALVELGAHLYHIGANVRDGRILSTDALAHFYRGNRRLSYKTTRTHLVPVFVFEEDCDVHQLFFVTGAYPKHIKDVMAWKEFYCKNVQSLAYWNGENFSKAYPRLVNNTGSDLKYVRRGAVINEYQSLVVPTESTFELTWAEFGWQGGD